MVDVRRARRDAEKAARDALSTTLVGVVGELGVAHAAQQDAAAAAVETARTKAAAIVEAATLVKEAEDSAGEALTAYATAWTAARDAGWSQAQLKSMGYEKASVSRKTKPTPAVEEPPAEPGAA